MKNKYFKFLDFLCANLDKIKSVPRRRFASRLLMVLYVINLNNHCYIFTRRMQNEKMFSVSILTSGYDREQHSALDDIHTDFAIQNESNILDAIKMNNVLKSAKNILNKSYA